MMLMCIAAASKQMHLHLVVYRWPREASKVCARELRNGCFIESDSERTTNNESMGAA